VSELMRDRGHQRHWITELRAAQGNQHSLFVLILAAGAVFQWVVCVEAGTPAGACAPVRKDAAKFLRLVGENFKLNVAALYCHVSAHSLEEQLRSVWSLVVRVREVLGGGQDDIRVEHALASQHSFQAREAAVNPLALFLGNRQL